jgi:hypothetical protein
MNKKSIIAAAAAVLLLVGATDAAMAHSQAGQPSSNGSGSEKSNDVLRVNVKINNIVLTANNVNVNTGSNASGNASSSTNTGNNTSGNANTNSGANSNANSSTNANNSSASASATAGATASSGANGSDGGASDVTVDGDDTPASSAAPIFLSTGDDTCMGAGGLGVQSADVGISLGSTWRDSNCVMLKNARELKNQGHDKAAKARLCMDEDNALAFELAGEPCPRALASTQAALAKIRAWNPDYERVAAAAPVQLASLDRDAGGEQVAIIPPDSREEATWLSEGVDSLVGVVKAVFHALSEAGAEHVSTAAWDPINFGAE